MGVHIPRNEVLLPVGMSWLLDWLFKRVLRDDKPEVEAVFDGLAGSEKQAEEKEGFHGRNGLSASSASLA